MDQHLRAGAAIFNAGYHHAAHDAWEASWLELDEGPAEQLLHGLIQYTAAVHHGDAGNWEGVTGLAASADTYLEAVPADYQGVNIAAIRSYLATLATDPEVIERTHPPQIRIDGCTPQLDELAIESAFIAAPILATTLDIDPTPVEEAVEYARSDLDTGEDGSEFISLVLAFLSDASHRDTVYQRIKSHVDRRRTKESDVDDLF